MTTRQIGFRCPEELAAELERLALAMDGSATWRAGRTKPATVSDALRFAAKLGLPLAFEGIEEKGGQTPRRKK